MRAESLEAVRWEYLVVIKEEDEIVRRFYKFIDMKLASLVSLCGSHEIGTFVSLSLFDHHYGVATNPDLRLRTDGPEIN